jgi:hypothetical protein
VKVKVYVEKVQGHVYIVDTDDPNVLDEFARQFGDQGDDAEPLDGDDVLELINEAHQEESITVLDRIGDYDGITSDEFVRATKAVTL